MPQENKPAANAEVPPLNNEGDNQEKPKSNDLVAKATHQRVLDESRKFKQRMFDAESKLKEIEESNLEDQKRYKELYERTKSDFEAEKKARVELQVKTQLIPELSKAGCLDVNDAMKLGDSALLLQDPDSDSLHGVSEYVNDLKQRKPWIFDTGKPSAVNPSIPAPGKVPAVGSETDYSALTKDQIKERLKSLGK